MSTCLSDEMTMSNKLDIRFPLVVLNVIDVRT